MEKFVVDPLPQIPTGSVISTLHEKINENKSKSSYDNVVDEKLFAKVENHLLEKIKAGDTVAPFLLGQFYFEEDLVEKALIQFERIKDHDYQAKYQLAVIYFDGLAKELNLEKGFELMMSIAKSTSKMCSHLKYHAQYNVGRAYFEGYGVKQSDEEAERWWLLAADDGNPKASVSAQTMLGLLYSRNDFLDVKKSFFWHSEACGNGSLESQGILGVMYLKGLGIAQSEENALECLKESAQRGNVYAQGRLVQFYYNKKLFTKASDLARRVVSYENPEQIAKETNCLVEYILKGITLAAIYLSRCLELGNGVRRDENEGKKYFMMACDLEPKLAYDAHMDKLFGLL